MNPSPPVASRLSGLIRARNRELAFDAALKAALGLGFCLATFGMMFWFGWVVGFFMGRSAGLEAWQFGGLFTGLFFAVAAWSAWRRVNPLAGLRPLTDAERLVLLVSHAAGGPGFSPRHASAGFAAVLIGGPAGVIEAFGIWAHRLRADERLIDAAAHLLSSCESGLPIEDIRSVGAACLLRRLALIKAVPRGDSHLVGLTEKGSNVLGKAAGKKRREQS